MEVYRRIINILGRTLRSSNTLLLLLFAGFFVPVSTQSQESQSLILKVKGQGLISSDVEKRKITSSLVVLRQNGTAILRQTDLSVEFDALKSYSPKRS